MKNKTLLAYRIVTGLFTFMIGSGVFMYATQTEMVQGMFTTLGYPPYLVYILGTMKVLGLVAIWTNKSALLKSWAYFGFFVNLSLGTLAHIAIGDGEFAGALICLILAITSFVLNNKVEKQ